MHMYLKLKGKFPRERLALDAWRRYHHLGAEVYAVEEGFAVRLPLGKQPQALYKFLKHVDPEGHDEWLLIGVTEEGEGVSMEFPPLSSPGNEHETEYLE